MPAESRSLDFEGAYMKAREQGADLIAEGLKILADGAPEDPRLKVVEVSHDNQGPRGGISSHVLFTLEIDGHLVPILASVYTGPKIDNQILAAAKRRQRMLERDQKLREALGMTSSSSLPALATLTITPDEPVLPVDEEDDDDY